MEQTPAQEAGLVIGKQYKVIAGAGDTHSVPHGTIVTFEEDDGTDFPDFSYDGGTSYIRLEQVVAVDDVLEQVSYTVTVAGSCTSIEVVGKGKLDCYKRLSFEEIASVLKILG